MKPGYINPHFCCLNHHLQRSLGGHHLPLIGFSHRPPLLPGWQPYCLSLDQKLVAKERLGDRWDSRIRTHCHLSHEQSTCWSVDVGDSTLLAIFYSHIYLKKCTSVIKHGWLRKLWTKWNVFLGNGSIYNGPLFIAMLNYPRVAKIELIPSWNS